jgi:NAD(P)-dependent dehydrogenase (short-subunit alcohol dehydrogenase family)
MTLSTVLPPRPSRRLDGKVAIVTGAGSHGDGLGNGRATSILLAEAGATVLCADRDQATAQRTVEMIVQEGGKAASIYADVSSEQDCEVLVKAAENQFGRLDILINNVGIMGAEGTAVEADANEWDQGLRINVTGMMLMAKFAIPLMLKNEPGDGGIRGSIVNMASIAGLQGGTPHLFYPTSKGAIVNMTRAMAYNHGHEGIRVNCVCPGTLLLPHLTFLVSNMPGILLTRGVIIGFLYTPMVAGDGMSDEIRDQRRRQGLLKTEGNAWDCAAAVRFLASDEARWITGTAMTVDAGVTCSYSMP